MLTITAGERASRSASTFPRRGSSQRGSSESSAITCAETRSAVRDEMWVMPTARSSSERRSFIADGWASKKSRAEK